MLRLFSGWLSAPDAPKRGHKVCSTSSYLTLGINILWLTYRTGLHEVSLLSSHLCSQSSSGLFFPVLQLMTHRIRTTCSHTSLSSHTNWVSFLLTFPSLDPPENRAMKLSKNMLDIDVLRNHSAVLIYSLCCRCSVLPPRGPGFPVLTLLPEEAPLLLHCCSASEQALSWSCF